MFLQLFLVAIVFVVCLTSCDSQGFIYFVDLMQKDPILGVIQLFSEYSGSIILLKGKRYIIGCHKVDSSVMPLQTNAIAGSHPQFFIK